MRHPTRVGLLTSVMSCAMTTMASFAQADPSYIYGIHDPGGEYLMGSHKGWIVWTEAIGTSGSGGNNYTSWSSQGYGVIVRLNNGYGSSGTLPYESQYGAFASRCANFIQNSSGVDYWIIGNETNLPREWPGNVNGDSGTGEPITSARYISCYNQCYSAIKAVAPSARLCPSPAGTWAPPYPAQGIEEFVDYWVNCLNGIGASKIDGLILHTYTHGCDPALVTSEVKMGPPYEDIYYHLRVYKNYMGVIPAGMQNKPVLITECDQNIECADGATPRHTWHNVNNGWMKAVYAEIDNWNQNNSHQIRCLTMFRWPMAAEGEWTFGLADRDQCQADFAEAAAFGYQWGSAPTPTIALSPTTLLPTTDVGSSPPNDTFTVQNAGTGTLNYSIGDNVHWLNTSPINGTSTGEADTITVTYSASGLSAGNHDAMITVSDSAATNNPQTIAVTLTVVDPTSNRVLNGDFSTDSNSDGVPDSWNEWHADWCETVGDVSIDNGALLLSSGGNVSFGVYQELNGLTPGHRYALDLQWKGTNYSNNNWYEVLLIDGSWNEAQADEPCTCNPNFMYAYANAKDCTGSGGLNYPGCPLTASFDWTWVNSLNNTCVDDSWNDRDGVRTASGTTMTVVLKAGAYEPPIPAQAAVWFDDVSLLDLDAVTCQKPVLNAAVSRKTHNTTPTFTDWDVDVGAGDIESRSNHLGAVGDPPNELKIIANFDPAVTPEFDLLGGSDVTTDNGTVNGVTKTGPTTLEIDIIDLGDRGDPDNLSTFNTQVNLAFPGVICLGDPSSTSDSTLCIRIIVGDYDNLGRTNYTDFALVKNAGYINQLVDSLDKARADFDCTGRPTFTDFSRIKNAGLINKTAPACPDPPIGP